MAIFQTRTRLARKFKNDMGHYITALDFRGFEGRITVTILTFFIREIHEFFLNSVVAINCLDDILDLDTIGSDVLNSRSPDLSRNIRQVLDTPKSLFGRPITEIIKDNTSTYGHKNRRRSLILLLKNLDKIDLRVEDGTLEVIGEQKIAAPSDMKHRTGQFLEFDINQIRNRIILDETLCLHLHSEGIHSGKVLIVSCVYHSFST